MKKHLDEILKNVGVSAQTIYFDSIDSTNSYAKEIGKDVQNELTVIVADSQTGGRGRFGRTFESPGDDSIYMSILLKTSIRPQNASMLTILAALAVRAAIEEISGIKAMIKWPNDIVVDGRKLCGILTEMSCEGDRVKYIVVGIGVNVNNKNMSGDLEKLAVSMRMLTEKCYDRWELVGKICKCFTEYYTEFMTKEDLEHIRDIYNGYLVHMNKEVYVAGADGTYSAISLGIDNKGELLVERNKEIYTVLSGEVSVRGVYGYV